MDLIVADVSGDGAVHWWGVGRRTDGEGALHRGGDQDPHDQVVQCNLISAQAWLAFTATSFIFETLSHFLTLYLLFFEPHDHSFIAFAVTQYIYKMNNALMEC